MSRRTVSRFSVAWLVVAAVAAPSMAGGQSPPAPPAAQAPNPWRVSAPPEAAKPRAGCLSFGLPPFLAVALDVGPANPVAPPDRARGVIDVECRMVRVASGDFDLFIGQVDPAAMPGQLPRAVAPPCCAFDCPQRLVPVSGTAPMPRGKVEAGPRIVVPTLGPIGLDIDVPLNKSAPDKEQLFNFSVGLFDVVDGPCPPGPPATSQACAAPCCDAAGGKLSGTWYRDLNGAVISTTFAKDELKLCVTQNAEGYTICVTLTAEYTVTKEGLVHGVVTGVDVDVKRDPRAVSCDEAGVEIAEASALLQELADCPFSFRVKQTSAGMMVSGLKVGAGAVGLSPIDRVTMCGMFKPAADGQVPAPKPMKSGVGCGLGRCEAYGAAVGGACAGVMTLPSPQYLQHYPQYYAPDLILPLPRELAAQEGPPRTLRRSTVENLEAVRELAAQEGPPCTPGVVCPNPVPVMPPLCKPGCGSCPQVVMPGWSPRPAPNVPAVEFGMMADVFAQMLGQNPTYTLPQTLGPVPQIVMPPAPVQMTGGVALPPTVYPTVQVMPPPPPSAPAVRVTTPLPPASAAKPGPVGTWVREVGPVVYVVKIEAGHLTITATAAMEAEAGRVVSEGMVLTADYHLSRDGTTLVGLVTGADATLDGDLPEDANLGNLGNELERVQKALTDQPFAMTVRVYGDVLMIGNVRLPQVEGGHGGMSPVAVVGGRYKAVSEGKPLPKPKPAKVSAPRNFDGPPPVCVPGQPCPAPPVPSAPGAVTPGDLIPPTNVLPPAPVGAPTAPPPPPVEAPKPGKKGKQQKYAEDPNVRMQQLLYQSEDLRKLHDEWKRFWFDDQPSHLTPERVHGGIR